MSDRNYCSIANVITATAIYIIELHCSFSFMTSLPLGRPHATDYHHRSTRMSHDGNV